MTRFFEAIARGGGEAARLVEAAMGLGAIATEARRESVEIPIRTLPLHPSSKAILPFGLENQLAAEQYRFLRARVTQDPAQSRVIAVSSGSQQDGKTVTAVNLAALLSMKQGVQVLLIDADLRRPSVAAALGLPRGPGIVEVLTRRSSLAEALVRTGPYPNLFVLAGGGRAENAAELLDGAEWKALCKSASRQFRYTIVDCPPFGPIADHHLIQATVDKIILVVRPDNTPRAACYQALRAIPRKKLLGVALNGIEKWPFQKYSGHPYAYEHYYRSSQEPGEESQESS